MLCSLESLRDKEVIDIETGERLGYIDDAEIDVTEAGVTALVIYGRERLWGLLGREEDVVISCRDIAVIGEEIILIKRSDAQLQRLQQKTRIFNCKIR